jgi:hypothetical protein
MGEAAGRTYGFGRVSPSAMRPSPYSPLHTPSRMPGSPATRAPAPRPGHPLGIFSSLTLGAVVVGAAIVAWYAFLGTEPELQPPVPVLAKSTAVAELSDESKRLLHSALAVTRPAVRPGRP